MINLFEASKKVRTHFNNSIDTMTIVQTSKTFVVDKHTGEILKMPNVQAAKNLEDDHDIFIFKCSYRNGATEVEIQ